MTTRIVPEGKDVLDGLSIGELDMASRRLQADVVDCFRTGAGGKRYHAMALVAWMWAKRTDPTAKIDTYMDLSTEEILQVLGLDDDDDEDDDQDPEQNPTVSARE